MTFKERYSASPSPNPFRFAYGPFMADIPGHPAPYTRVSMSLRVLLAAAAGEKHDDFTHQSERIRERDERVFGFLDVHVRNPARVFDDNLDVIVTHGRVGVA